MSEQKIDKKDVDLYDLKLREAQDWQALTNGRGWAGFYAWMVNEAERATENLKHADKMNDVVRFQSTIAFVNELKAKIRGTAMDLNGVRERYPLFYNDFPFRADFDDVTGRVTVIDMTAPVEDIVP